MAKKTKKTAKKKQKSSAKKKEEVVSCRCQDGPLGLTGDRPGLRELARPDYRQADGPHITAEGA